ncbi:MAG: redoxin family protein [Geothrix sp.]|nr:redoxin family protein [Geothrix sp.]
MRTPSSIRRLPDVRGWRGLGLAFLLLSAALPAAGPGQAAPPIQLMDRTGKSFSLEALKGQVVVVDFWASWCGPCRKSLPELDALQTRFAPQGVRVVGISLDADAASVTAFLEQVPLHFTILHDPAGRTGETFSVVAMPTTFLIDREGRIAARFEGGAHVQEETAAVAALLAGKEAPQGVRVASGLQATGSLKAWQRGNLADPIMSLDGDRLSAMLREHVHASKEGAAGTGGAAGGGCGCN